MGDNTAIEWTNATWNPTVGCSIVSPGCTNCYAMGQAARLLDGNPATPHYKDTTRRVNGNAVWTGKLALAPDDILLQPLKWKRPRMIFVNSMSDLFHESVPDEWIDKVFAVMDKARQHIFQILTKRPERMREYMRFRYELPDHIMAFYRDDDGNGPKQGWQPPRNVWLGVSCEDQKRADERLPLLLDTPGSVLWVSAEPLLGPLDLTLYLKKLDWIVVGGESGPGARPMHPDWARSIRDQCTAAGVPFFFKQWGAWNPVKVVDHGDGPFGVGAGGDPLLTYPNIPAYPSIRLGEQEMWRVGKKRAGRLLDGIEHNAMPGDTA